MRILQISSEYPPQQVFGLGRYVADLSREMASQGHRIHVLTNSIGGAELDVHDRGVILHRVEFPPPPKPPPSGGPIMAFNLHLQQRSAQLGREGLGNPEVVVSHDWLTALAAHRISRRWQIPHVWTVHDTVWGKRAGLIEDPEDVLAFRLETWAAQAADLILVNSRAIGQELSDRYAGPAAKTELLHPGLDGANFAFPPAPGRREAFRGLFAQPDELLITYCGRFDLEKGIDTLINAFSLLHRKVPRSRLVIAGSGRLEPMVKDHLRKLSLENSVDLPGYLEEDVLRFFYHASDIHVCPSHYEPFGLVAAEAMASGAPVVVSATGGLLDIVSSPEVGRTFPPRDPEKLAAALFELAGDPVLRKRLGKNGRKHVLREFAWSKLAARAAELYALPVEKGMVA